MNVLASLSTVNKAIAGFLASAVLWYLARHGFSADMTLGEFVKAVASGIVGFVTVYVAPKNKSNSSK